MQIRRGRVPIPTNVRAQPRPRGRPAAVRRASRAPCARADGTRQTTPAGSGATSTKPIAAHEQRRDRKRNKPQTSGVVKRPEDTRRPPFRAASMRPDELLIIATDPVILSANKQQKILNRRGNQWSFRDGEQCTRRAALGSIRSSARRAIDAFPVETWDARRESTFYGPQTERKTGQRPHCWKRAEIDARFLASSRPTGREDRGAWFDSAA